MITKKGKTHFEVYVLLFFSIFRHFTFILRHCIFVFLFLYRFRSSIRGRLNYLDTVNYIIDYVYFKNKKDYKKIKYIYLNTTYVN